MALCVSLCPPEELKTHQDLKRFAMTNGEPTRGYAHLATPIWQRPPGHAHLGLTLSCSSFLFCRN